LENKSPFQNTFTSSVVIYLTTLNHANAPTPGWNSSKVSKFPILLFVGVEKGFWWGGGNTTKRKKGKKKKKKKKE
jgi:hypothetical protein